MFTLLAAAALCVSGSRMLSPLSVTFTATGSFRTNGEFPSKNTIEIRGRRFASWSGSDANTGELVSSFFKAPAALVLEVDGYPSHPSQRVVLRKDDGLELPLALGPDPGTAWSPRLALIPRSWQGAKVQLVAQDGGIHWGDWIGIADVRSARVDELLLGRPIATLWSYIGFIYVFIIVRITWSVLRNFPDNRALFIEPKYLATCALVSALAYIVGWTNHDLSGFFAAWGRDTLIHGPAGVYEQSWIDNPPVNPALLGTSAFLEAMLRTGEAHLDPLLFKYIPLASLFILPFLARAALLACEISVPKARFIAIVLWTVANPAFIYLCAIWGENDIFEFDLTLVSVIALITGRQLLGGWAYGIAILTKPQPLVALPLIAALGVGRRALLAVCGALAALLLVLPATMPHGGFLGGYRWLIRLYVAASSEYPLADVGAGTLPAILAGDGIMPETLPGPFGLNLHDFSFSCVAIAMIIIFVSAVRERSRLRTPLGLWYLAVSCMAVYWFAPHMHERYITYAVAATILWAFAIRGKIGFWAAGVLSSALLLQMLINGLIDLGWGTDVITTLRKFAPHDFYYALYCPLNVAGFCLLLASRRWGNCRNLDTRIRPSEVHSTI